MSASNRRCQSVRRPTLFSDRTLSHNVRGHKRHVQHSELRTEQVTASRDPRIGQGRERERAERSEVNG
jgi:hypothetical protein